MSKSTKANSMKLFYTMILVFLVVSCDGSRADLKSNKIPGSYPTEYGPPIKNEWALVSGKDPYTNVNFIQAYSTLNDTRFPNIDVDAMIICTDFSYKGSSLPKIILMTLTDTRKTPLKIKIKSLNQVINEIGSEDKANEMKPVGLKIDGVPMNPYELNIQGKIYKTKFNDTYALAYTSIPKTNLGVDDTNMIAQLFSLKDLHNKTVEIEIPTIAGSPRVLIDTRNENIKKVLNLCSSNAKKGF